MFRVYRPLPPHYHATCDEYLLVVSGRALFFMADLPLFEVRPGRLLFFKKGVVHGAKAILEGPLVFLSVDTPRRDPKDIIFVNPEDGTPETFIRTQRLY
jgi:mannose-6-phosphate isomerase-like protein (cupin superfamily)